MAIYTVCSYCSVWPEAGYCCFTRTILLLQTLLLLLWCVHLCAYDVLQMYGSDAGEPA